jgi:Tol biopolymer transport system component
MSRKFIIIIIILVILPALGVGLTTSILAKRAGQKVKVEKKEKVVLVSKITSEEKARILEEFEKEKEKTRVKKILEEKISSPVLYNEDILYLSRADGLLHKISTKDQTKKEIISSEKFSVSSNLFWSPKKDRVIISNVNIDNISARNFLLDINSKKSQKLDDNIFYFTWSPDGEKIVYYYYDDLFDKRMISISNPDGSNWEKFLDLSGEKALEAKDVNVVWSGINNLILLYGKPLFLAEEFAEKNLIYSIHPNGSEMKELTREGYATDPLFSPDGQKILYNLVEEGGVKFTLNWIDKYGIKKENLGVESKTEKCTWSKDNINLYCALSEEIVIVSDLKVEMNAFWKINTETKGKEKLTNSVYVNAENLFLSTDEAKLYFIDKNDFTLHELALK